MRAQNPAASRQARVSRLPDGARVPESANPFFEDVRRPARGRPRAAQQGVPGRATRAGIRAALSRYLEGEGAGRRRDGHHAAPGAHHRRCSWRASSAGRRTPSVLVPRRECRSWRKGRHLSATARRVEDMASRRTTPARCSSWSSRPLVRHSNAAREIVSEVAVTSATHGEPAPVQLRVLEISAFEPVCVIQCTLLLAIVFFALGYNGAYRPSASSSGP